MTYYKYEGIPVYNIACPKSSEEVNKNFISFSEFYEKDQNSIVKIYMFLSSSKKKHAIYTHYLLI